MTTPLTQLPSHPSDYGYANIKPGQWWYCPWYLNEDGSPIGFLSEFYTAHGLGKRPPVCIMLPGRDAKTQGRAWCIDSKSENGRGWMVAGEEGLWSASPSIQTPEYHGWLKAGILSDPL